MVHFLAIDLGASSGRVMSAEFSGNHLVLEEVYRFANQPMYEGDRLYWNFQAIYDSVRAGITKAAGSHREIAALALDSWAVDFGVVNTHGDLVCPPMHYRDKRNVPAMERLLKLIDQNELFTRTGIQLQPFNTIFQLYAMSVAEPEMLTADHKLLLIPDLINFFLSGVQATEFTNATTTQMVGAGTGQWDEALVSLVGIPSELLAPIVQPGTIAGPLIDMQLRQYSSLTKTKITHTTSHDTASAVISVPSHSEPYVYISSGTWSLMGTLVQNPMVDDKVYEYNFTNEGGMGNYRLLKNIMGLWIVQEIHRELTEQGELANIKTLIHKARVAPKFTFLFDPDDRRLLQPENMIETIARICQETGQLIPKDIGSLIRGVFESLALKYRTVLEQLEEITREPYKTIHIVGGGSQNELLSQFTSNATGRAVKVGPVEASSLGNVLVQLLAIGEVGSETEMKELLARSFGPVDYVPMDQEEWQEAYERFQRIVKTQAEQRGE